MIIVPLLRSLSQCLTPSERITAWYEITKQNTFYFTHILGNNVIMSGTLSTEFRCFPFPSVSINAPPLGSEALLLNVDDDDRTW